VSQSNIVCPFLWITAYNIMKKISMYENMPIELCFLLWLVVNMLVVSCICRQNRAAAIWVNTEADVNSSVTVPAEHVEVCVDLANVLAHDTDVSPGLTVAFVSSVTIWEHTVWH